MTLAARQAALEQRFRARRTNQPNRSAVLLKLLNKTGAYGLKNWAQRITTGTDTGQVFSDGQDFTTFQADTDLPIILQWGLYGETFKITNLDADGSAGDPGDYADLVVKEGSDALDRAADKIEADLWAGPGTSGPQRLHGLTAAAGPLDDTGTYAGVDRALQPQWASNVFDNGGVPQDFSIAKIEEAIDATYTASGVKPSAVITSPTLWRATKRLSKQDAIERVVQVAGREYTLDPGVQALEIDGIPLFMARSCPTGTVVGLSMDHIGVERLAPAESRRAHLLATELPVIGTPEEQYYAPDVPRRELGAELYKLSRTGNQEKYAIETKIVLWTDKCNAHFRISNLTVS